MRRRFVSSILDPDMVDPKVVQDYNEQGFGIARGLFSREETEFFSRYFTEMLNRGGDGWAEGGVDFESSEPWRRWPRLLQPHRGDDVALGYMVDPRIREHLKTLLGEDPYAVQTMVYFKPPGATGQNLHQDNTYLMAQPGTCIAAWTALDDCDEENGCMVLVPNTQGLPVICQVENPSLVGECWGTVETPLPPGATVVPAIMKAGDTLFFNGSVIHGSYKNRSADRFRRTLIGHYVAAESRQVAKYYFPVYLMDGTRMDDALAVAEGGGKCGEYLVRDGELRVVEAGSFEEATKAH